MITEKQVKDKLKELEDDERISYPSAEIQTNAPLALIQLSIESKVSALKWVLKEQENLIVG